MAEITKESSSDKMWGIKDMPRIEEGKKCLVLGGAFYGSCVGLMAQAGWERAETVDEADLVVFIGGVDVNPELYNQAKHPMTQSPSKSRDELEKAVYEECIRLGKPMFGICRGAQFLHVMNGGELWQHVEGHAGPDHLIYDLDEDVFVKATSLHHQMLALNNKIEVAAVCKDQVSNIFESADMKIDLKGEGANSMVEIEIEAGFYKDTQCFFVQGHPEVGDTFYRTWTMTKLHEYLEEDVWMERPGSEKVEAIVDEWKIKNLL